MVNRHTTGSTSGAKKPGTGTATIANRIMLKNNRLGVAIAIRNGKNIGTKVMVTNGTNTPVKTAGINLANLATKVVQAASKSVKSGFAANLA